MHENTEFTTTREVEAIQIPSGTKTTIPAGTPGVVTQTLGGSYTIATYQGLARIAEKDLDAHRIGKALRPPTAKSRPKPRANRSMRKRFGNNCANAMTRKSRSTSLISAWFTTASSSKIRPEVQRSRSR